MDEYEFKAALYRILEAWLEELKAKKAKEIITADFDKLIDNTVALWPQL
jgi:hypothetical protein